jgi:hypothetical protein
MAKRKTEPAAATKKAPPEVGSQFERAFAEFRELINAERIEAQQPLGPAAVYTSLVTVWLLIYQRLHAGASLSQAVHELLRTGPEHLPDNRRVREGTLSANTGAYSRARQRLKPEVTDTVANDIFTSLMNATPPSVAGRRAFILDGTTIPLAPSPALKAAFPPAPNQYGSGVWPIAHLLVAHELESGCALLPEIGPKFGPQALGEAELARALLPRLPAQSIIIADRNFGIFSVAFAAQQAGHEALVRLTLQRFKALHKKLDEEAVAVADAVGKRWKFTWRPSTDERRNNPWLPADAALEVQLHEVRLSDELTLHLLTTWPCTTAEVAALYGRRQDVETDIREIKVLLKMEELPARSEPMLRKELAVSITAYNLVIQLRRLAAARVNQPPRRLSFARVWSAVRILLLAPHTWTAAEWRRRFELTLRVAGQHKLPNRPGRSYPRRAHTKRNKSTSGHRPPSTQ